MPHPTSSAPVPADDAPTTGIRLPIDIAGLSTIPRPLLEAAEKEAKSLLSGDAAAAATLVAVLGYFGVSATTGNLVLALIGLIPGAVVYGTTLYAQAQAAYRVWRDAERDVTPVAQPSADGVRLVKVTEVVA